MNLKMIACKVLQREISLLSATSENFIDLTYLRQGYHNEPEVLKAVLQREIDAIDADEDPRTRASLDFDAILIGYGLCSNGIQGISSKKYKLIIPKAHDCITLLLGSKEKYHSYFTEHGGGIYWYSAGWIDNTPMPSEERYTKTLASYTEKYGEDNAEYLMEMEQNWFREYNRCAYIKWDSLHMDKFERYTKDCAKYLNWDFDCLNGDESLLRDMLEGRWDLNKFLIVPPGRSPEPSYDANVIKVGRYRE